VSDERDGADAAGDGGENTGALTQPLRPTGKRSRQRAGGTALADFDDDETSAVELGLEAETDPDAGKALTRAGKDGPTRNPILFVVNYLKQVVAELRKVIWPNRRQMVNYTAVVLVFLVFMVTLIGVADLGLARLVMLIFGESGG